MRSAAVFALLAAACNVGDRYLIAPSTLSAIQVLPAAARVETAAPARREKGGQRVEVRASTFSLPEAVARPDGEIALPTRMRSKKIQLAQGLVWTGTPLSIAGLLMVILGSGAVRYSGIALAAVAEPVMIAGTVLWVQGAKAHPQELAPGLSGITYLGSDIR